MAGCSSLNISIQTPRLKIEDQSDVVAQWLAVVQSMIYSYMCSRSDRTYLVARYIRSLETADTQFLNQVTRKLGRVDSKRKIGAEKKLVSQYLHIRLEDLDPKAREPLWLQRFLYKRYPGLEPDQRAYFRDQILAMTDLDIMYGNLEHSGGGRGRTPTGSFTEAASQYFTDVLGESQALPDQIMLKIWNLFAVIKGATGTLQKYQQMHKIEIFAIPDHFCTPLALFEQMETLSGKYIVPPKKRASALEGIDPALRQKLAHTQVSSTVTEDMSEMAASVERLIKDVGIAIIKLTEVLSLNKRNLIASIWKHLAEFGAYEKSVRQMFKQIETFLETDLCKIRPHLDAINQYLALITHQGDPSDVEMAIKVMIQGFTQPLNVFKLNGIRRQVAEFKDQLRSLSIDLSENHLPLVKLKAVSNLLDSTLAAVETLQRVLEDRGGDKNGVPRFYYFFETWQAFYDLVDTLEQQLSLNYSFEYNLHQAWIFIGKLNHKNRRQNVRT